MAQKKDLDEIVSEEVKPKISKKTVADIVGTVSYNLITGGIIDYSAGLSASTILTSRLSRIPLYSVIGASYSWWREKAYQITKTTEESGKLKKIATDFISLNTFQVPIYVGLVAIGSYLTEGCVDWGKVKKGTTYLVETSPFISPTFGLYLDLVRKCFGVKPEPNIT